MAGKALYEPIQIGNITLKNRVGMSALTRNRAENTYPIELMKETEWYNAPGIWDDKHVAGWKDIVDAVHEAGGKIYAQLWHVGRAAHPDAPEQKLAGIPVYAPSAISARGGKFRNLPGKPGYVTPTAVDDPWVIINQFKHAAINAKKAGFDGVELHGANGYIVTQFLDNTSNHRTDQWGGSVENRSRFGLEVLKVLVEVFGRDVAIKLSPAGGYNDGMPLQDTLDTYSYFITEADKLNLSYIVLVRYSKTFDAEYDGVPRATKHDVLESYRPYIKNAKLFLNTEVTAEEGEKLVAAGKIDGIFIGFNWITHPDLVKRVLHGKALDNVPNIQLTQRNKSEDDWYTGYTDYPAAVY
ncbi:flavoprotein NADH-dependent oxidoreductase [Flammula alnicola]|nr:flavoprotein NADH-dependent oxidoreductase [Flammula alnicola]